MAFYVSLEQHGGVQTESLNLPDIQPFVSWRTKRLLFLSSAVLTVLVILTLAYVDRPGRPGAPLPEMVDLGDQIYLASQLRPEHMGTLKHQGFRGVMDFRPDGEEVGQPSNGEMAVAARRNRLLFRYIPIPHEAIPDDAVDDLVRGLKYSRPPIVLYCRTGRRAVRTLALAKASAPNGPGAEELLELARKAGFSADDLRDRILKRISERPTPKSNAN